MIMYTMKTRIVEIMQYSSLLLGRLALALALLPEPPHGNLRDGHANKRLRKLEMLQTGGEPALTVGHGLLGDVVAGAKGAHRANLGVRAASHGEPAGEGVAQLVVCLHHAVVVADVVLGDALPGEAGQGVAGRVGGDAEMALEKRLGLLDGVGLGRRRGARVVVVAAHEDEQLGAGRLVRARGRGDVGVVEDAQRPLRVVLAADGAGDEVPEPGGLEVLLRIPHVDRHDGDGVRLR